jgi:hypothetical protein
MPQLRAPTPLALLALLVLPVTLRSQERDSDRDPERASHRSLDLTVNGVGLSIGNSRRVTGLRINWRDEGLERVNGINLTLWAPRENPRAVIDGLALGLVAPQAAEINGAAIGLVASVTERSMTGIDIGGVATVSNGAVRGINLGGLAVVSGSETWGLSLAGLAVVSSGSVHGINVAGLAAVSDGQIVGLNLAGLAVVAADVRGRDGLGTIRWVTATLGGVEATRAISGFTVGAYRMRAPTIEGVALGLGQLQARRELHGVGMSAYTYVPGVQRGLSIGIYNDARELHGVQVGVINRARNNAGARRILPIVNWNFE